MACKIMNCFSVGQIFFLKEIYSWSYFAFTEVNSKMPTDFDRQILVLK